MSTWQDHWEDLAREERQRFEAIPLPDLLEQVRAGRFGRCFVLWDVVAERASLEDAGWPLFRVLEGDGDPLHRHACAAALLRLLGETILRPADLSADHPGRAGKLEQVRLALCERLGAPA